MIWKIANAQLRLVGTMIVIRLICSVHTYKLKVKCDRNCFLLSLCIVLYYPDLIFRFLREQEDLQ